MPLTDKTVQTLKSAGIIAAACVTIFTSIWFFAGPVIDAHIKKVVISYVHSAAYKIQERQISKEVSKEIFTEFLNSTAFTDRLDKFLNQSNANEVSLRKLLSIKMNIPQETVADKIADLYNKDRKRLRNLLRGINNLYPELRVWEIE